MSVVQLSAGQWIMVQAGNNGQSWGLGKHRGKYCKERYRGGYRGISVDVY